MTSRSPAKHLPAHFKRTLEETNNCLFTKGKDVKYACKCLVIQLMKCYSVRTNKNL